MYGRSLLSRANVGKTSLEHSLEQNELWSVRRCSLNRICDVASQAKGREVPELTSFLPIPRCASLEVAMKRTAILLAVSFFVFAVSGLAQAQIRVAHYDFENNTTRATLKPRASAKTAPAVQP